MAKYNKAHALSQFVKDIDEEQRRKKKLQEALDTHKQNSPTSSTSVKGKQIAPIRTDTQYIANRILGGQTIEQRYAPLMNVQETPTTSTELFNKLKEQNEASVNKQNSSGGIIDSFKEQYQAGLKKNKEEQNLQQQIEQEKKEQGILSEEELNELSRQALSNDKLSNKKMLGKKSGETDLEALQRIKLENAKKEQEYNKKSEKVKALNEIQGKKRADVINATSKLIKYGVEKKFLDNPLNDVDGGLGSTINMFRRISEKAKTGQRATVSDIVGSSGLSAIADRGRRINKSKLDSVEDNETTLNLKQQQSSLNKQLLSIKNKKSDKFKKTLREYNRITDELQAEQANILGLHDGALGGIERFSNVLTGGFDESTQGFDSTIDKLFGMESDKAKGATQTLSDKSFRDTNNKIGKTILEAAHSAGAMIPSIIAGIASGGISTAVAFGTYGGSAYNQAKRDGYTDEQATKYGVVNGGLEAILNKILPTFKLGGKNVYGKVATDKLTKKIMAKTVGNEALKRLVTDSAGEFTEEYLQEFLDPIVREALLEEDNGVGIIKGADGKKIASNIAKYTAHNFFSKENLHAGLLGALNSGLMGAPSAIKSNAYTKATGRSSETGLTQNEQAVIDNIVENRKAELKEKNGKVTKKDISKIEQEVRQDLERGYIETNDIERALSNEEWTKHDNVVKQKEQLENQIKELESKTPQDYKTMGELNSSNEELNRLKEQLKNIDTNTTRNELNSAMNGKITDKDTLLQRAYGEEIEKQNAYQFDKNEKITEQTKKINEDIEKLGLNNNIKIRDIVDLIKKLSNETGRQYRLIDNNSAEMEKVEGKNVDGFVKNGEVFINVDSENLINRILGHETTHLFEGTEDYTKLQNIAKEYAKTKGEYDSRKSSLEEVYKDIKDANIENELTSDLVGDYLFSDIEFVRNLSTEQPNIFKKMYNYVKHLYNMATAGSKEARQLEQLKYNFEKVYRENNQSKASNNTKMLLSGNALKEVSEIVSMTKEDAENSNIQFAKLKDNTIKALVDYGVKDLPMLERAGHVRENILTEEQARKLGYSTKNKHYHGLGVKTYLEIIDSMDNPIAIYQYTSKGKYSKNNFIVVTPFEIDGNKSIVPVEIEQKGRYNNINIDYNKIKSAYLETKDNYIDDLVKKGIIKEVVTQSSAEQVPLVNNNIPQNEPKVNSDIPTKYSIQNKEKNTQELDNSSFSNETKYSISNKDSNGRTLTKEQQNYFKDSKVVDDEGNLIVAHHGTDTDFNTFRHEFIGDDNKDGFGFYFTPNELKFDYDYKKSVYLDIKNPATTSEQIYEILRRQNELYDTIKNKEEVLKQIQKEFGVDGIIDSERNNIVAFNSNQIKSVDNTNPTSNPDIRYSLSVKEANTGTDNKGRKLTKQQIKKFENSKTTDENGNLITVYHTTTNRGVQFNEFNPVGTDYYKFGDQVVNYYTNSKNMSGSYADQEYVMADTKKITSMEEAKSLVKQMNEGLASENTIRIETKDKGYQLVNNIYKEAYEYAKSIWDNEITPEEKQIEKDYEELYKRYVESGYDNNLVPEFTALENYAKDYAQKLDRITDNMTPEERDAFLSFRKPEFVSVKTEPVIIGEYNSENELFRNLKQDIQKADSIKNKYQYEGYVNITNPYVVDAEGRNWNKVESKEDSKTTTNFLNLDTLTKDRLTQLAKDSKKRYEETYNEYKKWNDAKNSISGNLRNDNDLNTRLGNRFIEESTLPFVKEFINNDYNFEELEKQEKGLGKIHELRVNTDVMYNLYNNDFIPYSVYNEFNNSLVVPEEIREKVKEIINQTATYSEYDSEGHNSIKKQAKLIDIWENYLKSYKAYDNNGRYDYSIFDRQLLDGYLKEELGNNFVVRDEFGTYDWVLKDLYKVASHEFNEDFIRGEYNDWSVTNDIVKSIIALNKAGENYDGVIIKNVVDYGGDSDTHEPNDLYITFNSNQFKAFDNKTPTDDPDIRYKLSNKNDIAPITDNRNIRARDMLLPRQQEIQKAIAPIQEENKVLKQEVETLKKEVKGIRENNAITQEEFEQENRRIAPLLEEQEAPPEVEQVYDNLKDTTRMPKKEVKLLSKNIKDTLGLTNKQKLDLEEIIQDYSTSETATREDLYNDIKNRYGKQAIITEYEDIRNVQTKVKSMKLDVSDNIKHSIADYNKLKQKNFGKISFSRNGQPVDVVYQELNAEYPNYFPDNIYNETDQFQKIVEVANLENKSIEEYDIDDNYVRETSDYIYDSILDSKQDAIQKATEKAAKESLQGELKAPMPTKLTQLYDDIDTDDVISASVKYEGKFADKSVDQLQQVKRKLKHTIENPFANTETINAAREQYAELGQEFSRRGLNIKDTIVEDAIRLMEHKAQKKTKSDKSKATRTPLDFGTLDELQNRAKARKNGELIETLNQMDTETENKLIEEQNKTKPKKESKLKKALTYGQYLFTNRNVEIDNYAKETGNHNIQVLADQVSNIQTEISNNINNAQTDNNLNTIGKSITQIFSQADKSGLSEAFNDYLFHLSNIERHKWGKGSQVPMVDSFVLTEEYEKKYPEMKQWAKDVNKYNKNLLYKQADAGLITKELADGLSERYEFYVPFMENLEGEYTPDKTNTIKTRSTVKRAKGGSSRNLLGFEEAMIRQTESAISQIRKNQLYQEIVKTKENTTTDFENNTNPDIHDNGLFSDNGKYYLTAYVDGKATQVEIDKTLYHGLAQNGNRMIQQAEQKLSPITKPLQALSSARRNILTTWSPTFLITNPLKDIQDAPLNSKYAKDWAKSMPKSIKEIASGKGGVELENFLNGYGQANLRGDYNLDSGLSDVTKLVDKKSSNKGIGISKKMLKKIPQINEKIELIPRYAEYLASIENGCSQMEALYNAREVTTNFGRGGIITKALNRNGFTFLNANVQGMSKLVRNFSGENGGRAVLGCIAKATALGIAPALLNALLFDDDDDYDVIPDYIKDNYYLIKTSDKSFIRIPKGRMMSIFGSAARRTLEATKGRENAFEGYLTNAYNQVGVQNPLESNILAPIIQAKNNQTWYGSELVPKRLQTNKQDGTKIPAKQQYDASTDKFSIWLGDKLNISPYKINYVLDQYSGGVGDMILPTITEEAQSDKDDTAGKMIAPLKDKFTADSITDNKYVTNFYSKLEELGEKKNATGSKKDEMSYQYMQNISFEMGALYKEMREVQANTKLADSKKYAKVQNIKAEINKLAEEGMKGYKDVESYDNYARVGDRELYKYQSKNGKTGWSDSNGQYADDINQLGLTTQEKNEYYTTKMKMSDVANGFKEDEGAEKYRAVLKTIRNAKIPSDAKYELYNSWYGKSDEASSVIQDLGISANDYLKFKTADLTSNKNKNGYAIRGSKADKVTSYLNKTNLNKGQKAVLYRLSFSYKGNYSSTKYSNAYNKEIINYIDNSNLTYEESVNALKKLGFKVSKDGTVKWD